jgi:hypothetical protein
MSRLRLSLTAAVLISAVIPLSAAQRSSFSDDVTARKAAVRFLAAVDDYLARGRAANEEDPETLCLPEDVSGRRGAPLADDSMRGEGSIFSPEVARMFRRRIADTLRWHEHRSERTLVMLNHEESTAPPFVVGGLPPPSASDAMIPWLIDVLPALPPELEYRRVARDLVLVDRRIDMVVDVLRAALPLY